MAEVPRSDREREAVQDAKREIEHQMGWSAGAVDQILADGKTYPYDEDPAKHEALLRRIEAIAQARNDAVAELEARERARYFDLDHPEIQEAVSREWRRRSRRSAWRVAAVAVLFIVGVGGALNRCAERSRAIWAALQGG